MKNIDIKSILIGVLAAGLIMVSVGAVAPNPFKNTVPALPLLGINGKGKQAPREPFYFDSSQIGRYSYIMIEGGQGAMSMLDTSNGEVWFWTDIQAKKKSPHWVRTVRFKD